jgi:hemerythrin-like domain-containing protein
MEPPLACALAKPGAAKLQMRAKAAVTIVDFIEELVNTRFHPKEESLSMTYQAEQSCTNAGKLIMETLTQH